MTANDLIAEPGHCGRTWQSCNWKTPSGDIAFHERTCFPHNVFKPVTSQYWAGLYTDIALANRDAKQYGAVVEREFYCSDESPSWFLIFNDFNKACAYALPRMEVQP